MNIPDGVRDSLSMNKFILSCVDSNGEASIPMDVLDSLIGGYDNIKCWSDANNLILFLVVDKGVPHYEFSDSIHQCCICGNERLEVENTEVTLITCPRCGREGPAFERVKNAVVAWNKMNPK